MGASGLQVSRLGLGTLTWGRDTDEHEASDQLQSFVDAGGTLLDTGSAYGGGAAEELLGSLLGDVVPRREVVLCTKAGGARAGLAWAAGESPDTSRRAMLDALDQSLARLRTDHVDLWMVAGWNPAVPLEETLSALEAAVASGRARYTGVSNYSGWQTARAATLAADSRAGGLAAGGLVATQVEYSLVERGIEREVAPAAQALGLGLLAWSPLGRGVLTGKYRGGTPADSRAASPHFAPFVERHLDVRAQRIVDALVTASSGLGRDPGEIALAWARDRPGVAAAIVGARTAAQLQVSLSSEQVLLPVEIRDVLDELSAPTRSYPETAG